MRIKNTALSIAMISCLGFSAASFAKDGTINFTGAITETGCTIDSTTQTLSVPLGSVAKSTFTAAGDTASSKAFDIKLSGCPDKSQVSIRFTGERNAVNPDLLALQSGSTATNVAIGLFEADSSTKIALHSDSKPVTLAGATGTLSFVAKYVATAAAVTAGTANATADFTVMYK